MAISASTLAPFVNSDFNATDLAALAAVLNSGCTGATVQIGQAGGTVGLYGATPVARAAKPSGTTDEKVAAIILAGSNLGLWAA